MSLSTLLKKSLTMGDLTQETLKNAKDWQAFLKDHCSTSCYLFQIKKCGKDTCSYCCLHPVRLPQSEFDRVNFVPLPLMIWSEVDRPSFAALSVTSEAKEADKENKKLLIAAKVH